MKYGKTRMLKIRVNRIPNPKKNQNKVETKEKIREAYLDFILRNGHQPNSVYAFCKDLGLEELDFYTWYASFPAIESALWLQLFDQTVEMVQGQEVWKDYSSREKILSFFYSFMELLKSFRSFANFSLRKPEIIPGHVAALKKLKTSFYSFTETIIGEGFESGELSQRKLISDRYADAVWIQFVFILNFWIRDESDGFEKSDEAIEKGLNVTFDLMTRSPVDTLIDYGKFLVKNGIHI